jgi:hypothetical protein
MDWLRGLVNAPSSPLSGAGCADALPSPSTVSTATLDEGTARPDSVAYSEASCAAGYSPRGASRAGGDGERGRSSSARELETDGQDVEEDEEGDDADHDARFDRSRGGMDGVCASRCGSEISVGRFGEDADAGAGVYDDYALARGQAAAAAEAAAPAADQAAFRPRLSAAATELSLPAGVAAASVPACAAPGLGDAFCCSSHSHCSAFSAHAHGVTTVAAMSGNLGGGFGAFVGCAAGRTAYTAVASAPAPICTASAAVAPAGASAAAVAAASGALSSVAEPGFCIDSSAGGGGRPLAGAAASHLGFELGLGLALDGLFASQGSVGSGPSVPDSARSSGPASAGGAFSDPSPVAAGAAGPQRSSAAAHALLATLHEAHADGQYDEDEDLSRAAASSVLMGELLPSADDVDAWEALVSPSARSSSRCDTTTMMSRCASTAPAGSSGSSVSRHSSAGLLACAGASSAAMSDHATAAAAAFGFAAGARFAQSCTVAEAVAAARSLAARGAPTLR